MRTTIIFFLAFIGLTSNVLSYPISPRPLRQLIIESEYIIVGYVVNTTEGKKATNSLAATVAKIAIVETLQGNIVADTIEISFFPQIICPSPDKYYEDTYVISFMKKNKESGNFYTHALSYGSKTLQKETINIYKQRILEMQQILKISDKKKKFTETVEWLVKCAENEATVWEGTYELGPESSFLSKYSRNKKQNFKSVINPTQKERLKLALLNSRRWVDFGLVDLVYKDNEAEIDAFLLTKIKALEEECYWLAGDYMLRLKHKSNTPEMVKVLETYDRLRFNRDKKEELKDAIETFIKLVE